MTEISSETSSEQSQDPSLCADLVRRFDHDRYLTVLFCPAEDRDPLFALYAFNYEVARTRETVSEPMLGAIRLQWWREALDGIYAGRPREHPVVLALARAIGDRDLPRHRFDAIIDSREMDLSDAPLHTTADLTRYAEDTSARLTELAVQVAGGAGSEAALAAAGQVGRAWAFTGLLRALGFHADMRRLYIPADDLAAAGIDPETIYRGEFSPALKPVVERMAAAARRDIAAARALAGEVPRRSRPVLLLATLAEHYLACLDRAGGDPLAADFVAGAVRRQLGLVWRALRGRF